MAYSTDAVSLEAIQALVGVGGYEVTREGENLLRIREVDSDIIIRAVLEDTIVFFTVSCMVVREDSVTAALMRTMLNAENGISTSGFQLYRHKDNKVAITLNNFCKLQTLNHDDRDDILSCLKLLVIDVYAAKELLSGVLT